MRDVLDPEQLKWERAVRARPELHVVVRDVAPRNQSFDRDVHFRGYPKGPLYTPPETAFVSPFPAFTFEPAPAPPRPVEPAVRAVGDFARAHPLATLGLGVLAVGAINRFLRKPQTPDSQIPVEQRRLRRRLPRVVD